MNKNLGSELIIYSILLAGLSYLTHHLAPTIARPTLVTGLVGGGLCLVWGILAVLGKRSKALPILTLIPISFVMLSQAVLTWGGGTQRVPGWQKATLTIVVLLAFSMGMLLKIAYAGATFAGQPPSPTKEQPAKPQTTSRPESKPNAAQRP